MPAISTGPLFLSGLQSTESAIKPHSQLRESPPVLQSDAIDKIKKVLLGVIAAIVLFPISDRLERRIVHLMERLNLDLSTPQEVIQLWNFATSLSLKFLRFLFKTALLGLIVIVGPIFEERLFRDRLYTWMKDSVNNPDSLHSRILRVLGNGLIFGLAHLSLFQGWTNIPIVLITSAIGCCFAALREITGDTIASTTAHIFYNGGAMAQFLKIM